MPRPSRSHLAFALVALLAWALAPAPAAAEASTWTVDPAHSASQFAVKHLVISTVRGQFGKTTGTLRLDDQDPTKDSVEATVDVTTVDTREPNRDADLRSPNFFDAAKYPKMTFKSTKVEKAGADELKVTGDLTIKGTTKPVVFDVTASPKTITGMGGEIRRAFSGTTKINRKDFGLNWSKAVEAGPVVGDEVAITVDLEAIKDVPGAKAKAQATSKKEK